MNEVDGWSTIVPQTIMVCFGGMLVYQVIYKVDDLPSKWLSRWLRMLWHSSAIEQKIIYLFNNLLHLISNMIMICLVSETPKIFGVSDDSKFGQPGGLRSSNLEH